MQEARQRGFACLLTGGQRCVQCGLHACRGLRCTRGQCGREESDGELVGRHRDGALFLMRRWQYETDNTAVASLGKV